MRIIAAFAALALTAACGTPTERTSTIEIDLGTDASSLEGLSLSAAGTLWVMSADLLHELSLDGEHLRSIDLAELQPEGDRYRDVLDLGDGTFAASHTEAVARLFPEENRAEDYFCLLPGDFEPIEEEPQPSDPVEPAPLSRLNPALSADLDDDRIYATPRVFQDGQLIDNDLVEYTVSTGVLLRAFDLGDYRPDAIAVRDDVAILLEGGRLTRLDISGRDAQLLETQPLSGVINAVGAAFDDDRLLVLDGATREIAVFQD